MRARIVCALAVVALTACGMNQSVARHGDEPIRVVAAENFWGDIAGQLGGPYVKVTSIISDPSADPHLYESDARDAAAIARAQLVIENGLGYDDFVADQLASSMKEGGATLVVADVLHVTDDHANPHLWYDIPRVHDVAQAIVAQLTNDDPAHEATFDANLAAFDASLTPILAVIDAIKTKQPGAPVAYTERVAGYLLEAAGLVVESPAGFAEAIEDGNEPSPSDTQAMKKLMTSHGIKALLYNAQATSPVTDDVKDLARRNGIPIVSVTETMPANEPNYQGWMLHQAQALATAVHA